MDTPIMRVEEMTELFERGQNVTECLPTGEKRFIVCVDGFEGAVDAVRKGQPVKGLEFFNPTDGSVQVLRQSGGVLVCYDSPGLDGKVANYLAKNKAALKNAEGIQNFVKFLGENAGVNPATGLPDVWDSDIKWASKLTGAPEQIGNGTVFSGAKAQEAVQAIPVRPGARFQGPTGTPQIAGSEGAFIVKDSTGSMHMIQAAQFRDAYSPVKTTVSKTRQVVNSWNELLHMPVSRVHGRIREGVSLAIHSVGQGVASTRAGQTIAKAAQSSPVKMARGVLRAGGKVFLPLMLADGTMSAKLGEGDVVGVGKDFAQAARDLYKAIVSDGEERKEFGKLWSEIKEKPSLIGKALWDGAKMTGQSALMAVLPDAVGIGDMKCRMGHVEKPITDENGKPVIKNGEVRMGDVFYVAMQDKKHPNQVYFYQRAGSEMDLSAIFDIDKNGRILSEYNVYGDENLEQRTKTEYDSTNVTSLKERYGIDLDDFSFIKGNLRRTNPAFRMLDSFIGDSASSIGKPAKIVTETFLDENSPQWSDKLKRFQNDKMEFQNDDTELVCTRTIHSKRTEYPFYYTDGIKIGSDVVIEKVTQTRRYFFTEKEKAELCKIKESGDPEKAMEALAKVLAKKDEEKKDNPDSRMCQDAISDTAITYSREYYTGNPDLKHVKTPHDDEFFNQYDCVLAKKESYTDKEIARGDGEKEETEPLNFNISIGRGSQLAHDSNGHVIRGRLDYQHHQMKQEDVSTDSGYDYLGEKAVFVYRKNGNGQTEVAQMMRVNPNTGVIKEFDANGNFVDVHVPGSEKHDELALTIHSTVKVPGFNEETAKKRLAVKKQKKEEKTDLTATENTEISNEAESTQEKTETKPNLLTALDRCATKPQEENHSLNLINDGGRVV